MNQEEAVLAGLSLADKAVPLFIVAATVYRFVGDRNWDPQERLQTILKFQEIGQLEQMEQTYLPVLMQLMATLSDSRDKEKLVPRVPNNYWIHCHFGRTAFRDVNGSPAECVRRRCILFYGFPLTLRLRFGLFICL